jgi:hypothetical protein
MSQHAMQVRLRFKAEGTANLCRFVAKLKQTKHLQLKEQRVLSVQVKQAGRVMSQCLAAEGL